MSGPSRLPPSVNPGEDPNRPVTSGSTRRNAASFIPKTSLFNRLKSPSGSGGHSSNSNHSNHLNAPGVPTKGVIGETFSRGKGRSTISFSQDVLRTSRNAGDKIDNGGSDHEAETDRNGNTNVYRTTSPLFAVKSDQELDRSLEAALEKCATMGNNIIANINDSSELEGMEITVCEGFPANWKAFRDDDILCDCVIQANDGKDFKAHRCLVAASCPYFHDIFCNPSSSRSASAAEPSMMTEGLQRVSLRTVDSTSLKAILDFAYTGDFEKSVRSVANLLPIAHKFKMIPVMQQCCAYLIDNMSADNALHIYLFAKPHFCSQLQAKAKSFILHNFRNVIQTLDFLNLSSEELKAILKDDYLNARNEAMVFEAVRAWVEHSPLKRRKNIPELLGCVRFGLMSYGYFTNVVYQWHFVNEDEAVRRALEAPSVMLTSIDSLNNNEVDLNDPLARPRIPYEIIFAVGGWSAGSPTAFVETYDIRADRWFLLDNTDSSPRAYHGLVTLGRFIYMIGGFDGQEHFSTVKRYDPVIHEWEEKSCMLFPRCYVSCCELDGIIYACGGYNGRTRMASAEKYIPELNQWELISPMNRPRSDASAAALRGKVYIAGGFTGTEVLNSVETYDPKENQWTFIQPMNNSRSGISLVTYRDCLYAVGGFNGINRLNTAERYDPDDSGPWRMIPEMSSARSNFAAVCADELLICIGGFNGSTTIPYVECYDSKVNEWFDASHMNLNRSALSACVVNNLPNAREYSYIHRIQELLGIPNSLEMDI